MDGVVDKRPVTESLSSTAETFGEWDPLFRFSGTSPTRTDTCLSSDVYLTSKVILNVLATFNTKHINSINFLVCPSCVLILPQPGRRHHGSQPGYFPNQNAMATATPSVLRLGPEEDNASASILREALLSHFAPSSSSVDAGPNVLDVRNRYFTARVRLEGLGVEGPPAGLVKEDGIVLVFDALRSNPDLPDPGVSGTFNELSFVHREAEAKERCGGLLRLCVGGVGGVAGGPRDPGRAARGGVFPEDSVVFGPRLRVRGSGSVTRGPTAGPRRSRKRRLCPHRGSHCRNHVDIGPNGILGDTGNRHQRHPESCTPHPDEPRQQERLTRETGQRQRKQPRGRDHHPGANRHERTDRRRRLQKPSRNPWWCRG